MSVDEYKTRVILGVGDGTGNLFVEGDYESIVVLQKKILELEAVRRENRSLKKKLDAITALISDSGL